MLNLSFSSLYSHSSFILFSLSSFFVTDCNEYFVIQFDADKFESKSSLRFRDGHKKEMKTERLRIEKKIKRERILFFIAVGYFTFNISRLDCLYIQTHLFTKKMTKTEKKVGERDIEQREKRDDTFNVWPRQSQCKRRRKIIFT